MNNICIIVDLLQVDLVTCAAGGVLLFLSSAPQRHAGGERLSDGRQRLLAAADTGTGALCSVAVAAGRCGGGLVRGRQGVGECVEKVTGGRLAHRFACTWGACRSRSVGSLMSRAPRRAPPAHCSTGRAHWRASIIASVVGFRPHRYAYLKLSVHALLTIPAGYMTRRWMATCSRCGG